MSVPGRSCNSPVTRYRRQVPATQGSEKSCKKSDEVIVVMKHGKPCGAKDRNTVAFLEGKHAEHWRFDRAWEHNNKI